MEQPGRHYTGTKFSMIKEIAPYEIIGLHRGRQGWIELKSENLEMNSRGCGEKRTLTQCGGNVD